MPMQMMNWHLKSNPWVQIFARILLWGNIFYFAAYYFSGPIYERMSTGIGHPKSWMTIELHLLIGFINVAAAFVITANRRLLGMMIFICTGTVLLMAQTDLQRGIVSRLAFSHWDVGVLLILEAAFFLKRARDFKF